MSRIFYRDADEFNKTLDKASESIRTAAGPEIVGNVIWWGLVVFQAFLYGCDWIFDWEVRRQIIPGIDVVKPLWVVIIGLIIYHHAWTRDRHHRILRNRLCFKCGTKLLEAEVDDDGGGRCPKCDRDFNLGEYRRPDENRGSGFQGYIDRDHFDKAMYAAAEQIKKSRSFGFEGDLLGWCWLGLGVSAVCKWLLGWDVFEWLPWSGPYNGVWLILLLIWSGIYSARVKRLRPAIVDRRRCFNCGYSLLHTLTDEHGLGRCSECGCEFATAQYERPALGAKAG